IPVPPRRAAPRACGACRSTAPHAGTNTFRRCWNCCVPPPWCPEGISDPPMPSPTPCTHKPLRNLPLASLVCGALAGCAYIPSAGPLTKDVENEYDASAAQHPFVLDEVSDKTIEVLNQRVDPSLGALAGGE